MGAMRPSYGESLLRSPDYVSHTSRGGGGGEGDWSSRPRSVDCSPVDAHHATHQSFKVPLRVVIVKYPWLLLKHLVNVAPTKEKRDAPVKIQPLWLKYNRNKLALPVPKASLALGINGHTVAEESDGLWVGDGPLRLRRCEEFLEGRRAHQNDVVATLNVSHVPLQDVERLQVDETEVRGHHEPVLGEVVVQASDAIAVSLDSSLIWRPIRGGRVREVAEEHVVSTAQRVDIGDYVISGSEPSYWSMCLSDNVVCHYCKRGGGGGGGGGKYAHKLCLSHV